MLPTYKQLYRQLFIWYVRRILLVSHPHCEETTEAGGRSLIICLCQAINVVFIIEIIVLMHFIITVILKIIFLLKIAMFN